MFKIRGKERRELKKELAKLEAELSRMWFTEERKELSVHVKTLEKILSEQI